jgi:hypothetical protein
LVTAAGSPSRGVASKLAHHAPHSVMIVRE